MNRLPNLVLSVLIFVFTAVCCHASDIYLAQAAVGGNTGADCADALAVTFFNTSSNWASTATSGKISPGTTVHLCGRFTASPGSSNYLAFQGSGTPGTPITLLFESGAVLEATYWSGCALTLNGHSYITVNGGSNGEIEATANGTGLANQQDQGVGVCSGSTGVSNVTIENLTVSDIYVHTCTEPVANCTDEGGQNTYGIDLWGGSNDSIQKNTVHDVKWAIYVPYGSGATTSLNLTISNNTVYNMDHGAVFGDQGTNSVLTSSNCSSAIYNNDFSNMQPWDATGDVNHHDATHVWANNTSAGSSYSGVCVYSNYFHGDAGATDNSVFGMESYGNGDYTFNNVVSLTGYSSCATGGIAFWSGAGTNGSAQHAFNNTVSPTPTCGQAVTYEENSGGVFENNLILTGNGTYVYTDGTAGTLSTVDYNYYQTPAGGNAFYGPTGCKSGASFSTWQSGCGFDTHGHNASIAVNSDFTLPAGSAGTGAGTNLTSLGITALDTSAPETFGVNGACGTGCIARSPTAGWSVGAYDVGSALQPSPATSLTAQPH